MKLQKEKKKILHGNLILLHKTGVFITGKSGMGKSETSLELIMKGAKLIADDIVELERNENKIYGSSPAVIRGFIEIRGLGIIDARRMFGNSSVLKSCRVDLVVELVESNNKTKCERLGFEDRNTDLLGIKLPIHIIPVRLGRNLSTLIEIAVRNFVLKKRGYNAVRELTKKIDRQMNSELI